jgi:hypothetical protein
VLDFKAVRYLLLRIVTNILSKRKQLAPESDSGANYVSIELITMSLKAAIGIARRVYKSKLVRSKKGMGVEYKTMMPLDALTLN